MHVDIVIWRASANPWQRGITILSDYGDHHGFVSLTDSGECLGKLVTSAGQIVASSEAHLTEEQLAEVEHSMSAADIQSWTGEVADVYEAARIAFGKVCSLLGP